MTRIELTVNGGPITGEVEPRMHLADFLRDRQRLTATHLRCEQGVCGACTILVDGVPARSCITYAVQCHGSDVTTLEGLRDDPIMQSLREAFSAEHGLQCGFCTPGMLITAHDIASRLPHADTDRVRRELSGNLCRCTGYAGIVRAVCRVLEERIGANVQPVVTKRLGPAGARHATGPLQSLDAPAPGATAQTAVAGTADASEADLGLGKRKANLETNLSFTVGRPVEEVWAVLENVERVARCMPGASLAGPPVNGQIKGSVSVKIGPIATSFSGIGRIVRDEERRRGVLYGSARDRFSGSSTRAEVVYALHGDGNATTRIDLTVQALLAGPLAQFGRSGIVQDLVARLANEFARRLEHSLVTGEEAPDDGAALNPVGLFFSVIKTRILATLRRMFRRSK